MPNQNDEHESRIARLEVDVESLRKEQQHHADHHLELSKIASEFRASKVDAETSRLRLLSDLKAENQMMVASIQSSLTSAPTATSRAVTSANVYQAIVLVVIALVWIVGYRLGLSLEALGGATLAVLSVAAWMLRSQRSRGGGPPPGSTGLSLGPPRMNGKGPHK